MRKIIDGLKTDKRQIVLAFRLTAAEAAHLDAAGSSLKRPRSRADYARAAALYLAKHQVPAPSAPVRLPPRRLPTMDIRMLCKLLGAAGSIADSVSDLLAVAQAEGANAVGENLEEISKEVLRLREALFRTLVRSPAESVQP